MTIDDLFYTCYPTHATQPARLTPDTTPQAADDAEKIPQAATAENAGNMAEKAIEDIPETGNMPETTTTGNMPETTTTGNMPETTTTGNTPQQ